MTMLYSKYGMRLTESFESCRLEAYRDIKGVLTIGWGHTSGVQMGDTCTQEQADQWFLDDVAPAETCINDAVRVTLTQNEFDALCCFVFNVGCGAFKGSTLLSLLNSGGDPSTQFVRWDKIDGQPSNGLLRRREAERDLFLQT